MLVREALQKLRALGAVPLRQKGSHQVWRLPNGRTVVLVVNHVSDPISRIVRAKVERALGRKLADEEER